MWIDTHAHLDDDRLARDFGAILERARAAGVEQILTIGTTRQDSAEALRLAKTHRGVFAALAIQPNHVAEAESGDFEAIAGWAEAEPVDVMAIGETGLDLYWDRAPLVDQQAMFDRHLELAERLQRPVVIHCRQSESEIVDQLRRWGRPVRGVLHSFTGDAEQAEAFLEAGLHISFAGQVTFTNKSLESLREAARRVPIDRILVETDSPYLSPHPHRGKLNEPSRVAVTGTRVAELRGLDPEEFAAITTSNARALFGLPDDQIL